MRHSKETLATATVVVGIVLCALLAIDYPVIEAFYAVGPQLPSSHDSIPHHHVTRKITLVSVGASRQENAVANGQASLTPAKQRGGTSLEDMNLVTSKTCTAAACDGARGATKQALLETIGYGVIDPVAYQTFKDSLLPPKYRPTVRVRVAVGVYSFAQEFLGFPPEEGVSSFAASDSIRPSVSNVAAIGVGKAAESVETYAPFAKIPGLGTRMTILQLQNGDVLFHSPAAPTLQLLDMIKDVFPTIGPLSKVHLVSASRSPEHWAFVKHWKSVFPSAKVWAVPGPHRRLMGVKVDYDLKQGCPVPEVLGGELEVAVLEGIPGYREAILLHKPTGMLLSSDLLLSMDRGSLKRKQSLRSVGLSEAGDGPDLKMPTTATPSPITGPSLETPTKTFGGANRSAPAARAGIGRGGRLWWKLLDRTSSLLEVNNLAVFMPFRIVLRAFKGNSADVAARVLSWDVKVFVGCHGQSPLEGPEVKAMVRSALGRYVDEPGGNSGNSKSAKKNSARGNRIPGIFPKSIRRRWAKDELQAIKSAAVDAAVASPPAERRLSPSCSLHEADREAGARSGGIDGGWDATAIMYPSASLDKSLSPSGSTTSTPKDPAGPSVLPPQLQRNPSDGTPSSTATTTPTTTPAVHEENTPNSREQIPVPSPQSPVTSGATAGSSTPEQLHNRVDIISGDSQQRHAISSSVTFPRAKTKSEMGGVRGGMPDDSAVLASWGMPTGGEGKAQVVKDTGVRQQTREWDQKGTSTSERKPSTLGVGDVRQEQQETSRSSIATSNSARVEPRARKYVTEAADKRAGQAALEVLTASSSKVSTKSDGDGFSAGEKCGEARPNSQGSVEDGDRESSGCEVAGGGGSGGGSGGGGEETPFVRGSPNTSYDESPPGPDVYGDRPDPFEAPFYPFEDNAGPGQ